ncbi:formylglycine-generating enzyme family protein [Krasilnikoviella flava]|uniref:Formylglycine-generating enzyme, required for sulfatase activity, contains SUMF1/FGE domain n=1 Tax=Krasilnikoviella flava TaxID=526729 RepID=A0A1T5KEJ2_9MICO|nr:formylglycine-generating enzyme family protein [Krasilnikoviella flava]SKC62126.1 Formylglycine-generating enzyme, required for sulfatase activity, contains SUMF1/FGE domain [Krasilnikoviella flava]
MTTATALTPLVEVPAGRFRMGSTEFYPDEGPVRDVEVDAFAVEQHPVTNAQFARFVAETGYLTVAERELDPADFPGADPAVLVPGGLVFTPTRGPVDLADWTRWWRWQAGASWRHPGGPGTGVDGRGDHPVVLVAFDDALAYARWAGRDLPTEAEFEYAARGGTDGARYAWGDEPRPDGRLMANTWQGRFPYANTGAGGWVGTSPVGSFPANGYGLADMIGNVWEWTTTFYLTGDARHAHDGACCAPSSDDLGPAARASIAPGERQPRKALKGGSHLCAPEYCLRYRPAARSAQSVDSATTHIGFRCVVRPAAPAMPAGAADLLAG